jgi:hypothetical protein
MKEEAFLGCLKIPFQQLYSDDEDTFETSTTTINCSSEFETSDM